MNFQIKYELTSRDYSISTRNFNYLCAPTTQPMRWKKFQILKARKQRLLSPTSNNSLDTDVSAAIVAALADVGTVGVHSANISAVGSDHGCRLCLDFGYGAVARLVHCSIRKTLVTVNLHMSKVSPQAKAEICQLYHNNFVPVFFYTFAEFCSFPHSCWNALVMVFGILVWCAESAALQLFLCDSLA